MNTDPSILAAQFEEYLAYMASHNKSRDSIKSYGKTYRLYIREGYAVLDTDSVEKFLLRYPNPATFNKALNHLRSFARWAQRKGKGYWGHTVGTFMVEQQKVNVDLPAVVSDEDADKLVAALKERHPKTWAFLVLKKNTGLRFSEVLHLRRQHLRRMEGGIVAVQFRGKGGAERLVTLNAAAQDAFPVWVRGDRFPAENTIRYHWEMAEKEAGLTHVRPHWFRHTVATKLSIKNVEIERIADILGNTVEVCRARYRRMNPFKLAEATDLL